MEDWTRSEHCRSGIHCETCRNEEGGRDWRASVRSLFAVPGNRTDWACPEGLPWGYRAGPASLIIPACNEDDLAATVASALEAPVVAEVVVIDDASPDLVSLHVRGVRVIRSDTPLGVGRARNLGAAAATQPVLLFADAHMRFPPGAIAQLATLAARTGGLVCPVCEAMHGGVAGAGAALWWDEDAGVVIKWRHSLEPELARVPAVLGACYAVRRDVWARLGPWPDTAGRWGFSEEGISIKARLLGVPVLCATRVRVRHLFRSRTEQPFEVPPRDPALNQCRALYCLFGDETWRTRIRPAMCRLLDEETVGEIEREPENVAERAATAAAKRASDQAVFDWLVQSKRPARPGGAAGAAPSVRDLTAVLCCWRRPDSARRIVGELRACGLQHIWVWADEDAEVPDGATGAVVCRGNLGPGVRWSHALQAPTDWIFIQDDDVQVSREAISALVGAAGSRPDTLVVQAGDMLDGRRVYGRAIAEPAEVDIALPGWGCVVHKRVIARALAEAAELGLSDRLADQIVMSSALYLGARRRPVVVPVPQPGFRILTHEHALYESQDYRNAKRSLIETARSLGWRSIAEDQGPAVTCLCPTYGRFSKLRTALACFLAQDYPRKRLLILNDAPVPIECGEPGVQVVNARKRYATLGDKRQALLDMVETELAAHWDDDDLYLPWHLSQAVAALTRTGAGCVRPSRAWYAHGPDDALAIDRDVANNLEGQLVFVTERARSHGYSRVDSGQALRLLDGFRGAGDLVLYDPEPGWSYVYRWDDGLTHISAAGSGEIFARNADFGDGSPLTPADLGPLFEAVSRGAGLAMAQAPEPRARPVWTGSEHCLSRIHCRTCRDREGGRAWRKSIAAAFAVPDGGADWECPFGIGWGEDGRGKDAVPCPYEYPATAETCGRCLADPAVRMQVYGQWLRRRQQSLLSENCRYRAAQPSGEVEMVCCGGEVRKVPVYACERKGRTVHVGDCSRCAENTVYTLSESELRVLFPTLPGCEKPARADPAGRGKPAAGTR